MISPDRITELRPLTSRVYDNNLFQETFRELSPEEVLEKLTEGLKADFKENMILPPVIDFRLYKNLPPQKMEQVITADLKNSFIEQAERLPPERKITINKFEVSDRRVIDPISGKDIIEQLNRKIFDSVSGKMLPMDQILDGAPPPTERPEPLLKWALDIQECMATFRTREYILNNNSGIICWFSPPSEKYGYKQGRLVLYEMKDMEVVSYAISVVDLPLERYHQIVNSLRSFSSKDYSNFATEEKIRSTPILVDRSPDGMSLWEVLEEKIPLEKTWEVIGSGEAAFLNEEEAEPFAQRVAKRAVPEVSMARTDFDYILIGYKAEREAPYGITAWGLDCPGSSNTAMLTTLTGVRLNGNFQTHYSLSLRVTESEVSVLNFKEEKKFHGKCPICGIEVTLSKGKKCPYCPWVYEG